MYLLIRTCKFISFVLANYLLIFFSNDIDVEQFQKDLNSLLAHHGISDILIYLIISIFVVILTFIIKQILNPFVEIFIMRYYKLSFYILINLLSISTTYIVLRIYGYSRFNLILYLAFASLLFEIFDRVERKFL